MMEQNDTFRRQKYERNESGGIRMRRAIALLLLLIAGIRTPQGTQTPKIILTACYQQSGWDNRVEVGYITDDGGMFVLLARAMI
jgi:hypothetical protein